MAEIVDWNLNLILNCVRENIYFFSIIVYVCMNLQHFSYLDIYLCVISL